MVSSCRAGPHQPCWLRCTLWLSAGCRSENLPSLRSDVAGTPSSRTGSQSPAGPAGVSLSTRPHGATFYDQRHRTPSRSCCSCTVRRENNTRHLPSPLPRGLPRWLWDDSEETSPLDRRWRVAGPSCVRSWDWAGHAEARCFSLRCAS